METMRNISVIYFAALREQAKKREEKIDTSSETAVELYRELQSRYGFTLDSTEITVAINDRNASLGVVLQSGDRVVFIPPVAGG